jgi:GNAT superfamily N-acetyltransferase
MNRPADRIAIPAIRLRLAEPSDIGALVPLIALSVRALQRDDYPPHQLDLALEHVYGVDTQLIADRTYFVIEAGGEIVACGGWSRRATLCGGDQFGARSDAALDAATDAAKIRAFYVRPDAARRGLASLVLAACERDAAAAGFRRAELGATLTGERFYSRRGYRATGRADVALPNGETLAVVRMERMLP